MKPRSDTNSKAKPQRRASEVDSARHGNRETNRETSLSRELPGNTKVPGTRGALEKESTSQGSEFNDDGE
mgnify:CR=1 FL=1